MRYDSLCAFLAPKGWNPIHLFLKHMNVKSHFRRIPRQGIEKQQFSVVRPVEDPRL